MHLYRNFSLKLPSVHFTYVGYCCSINSIITAVKRSVFISEKIRSSMKVVLPKY